MLSDSRRNVIKCFIEIKVQNKVKAKQKETGKKSFTNIYAMSTRKKICKEHRIQIKKLQKAQ